MSKLLDYLIHPFYPRFIVVKSPDNETVMEAVKMSTPNYAVYFNDLYLGEWRIREVLELSDGVRENEAELLILTEDMHN